MSLPKVLSSFFVVASMTSSALGQDIAAAEALFNQGVADLGRGEFATACPALAESQRLDPRPGTVFALAECFAKAGKVASAVATYQDYLALVPQLPSAQRQRHQERAEIASRALATLSPTVPTLAIRVPSNSEKVRRISRDGIELKRAALNVALPVDPGSHQIQVEYESLPAKIYAVALAVGEKKELTIEVPQTETVAGETSSAGPVPNARQSKGSGHPVTDSPRAPNSSDHTYALVTGSVGLVGVAVGSAAGLVVLSKKSKIQAECDNFGCSSTGMDAVDSAKSMAWVSNVGFGVGAAGLITAGILYLTGGSETATTGQRWTFAATGAPGAAQGIVGRRF